MVARPIDLSLLGLRAGVMKLAAFPTIDFEQLQMGIEVEMEHTDDPRIARKIALDHLSEVSDYYTRLKLVERRKARPQAQEETSSQQIEKDLPHAPVEDSPVSEIEDQIDEITHPDTSRHIARPFDRLIVKDTDGKTVDVWEVLTSGTGSKEISVRSLKTGARISVPAKIFELKKYSANGETQVVERVSKELFSVNNKEDGKYEIQNVPILCTMKRTSIGSWRRIGRTKRVSPRSFLEVRNMPMSLL
jgi:hypothetical protein